MAAASPRHTMCGCGLDVRSNEGEHQSAAGLVCRNDVRHLVPAVHRRAGLYREATPRPAVPRRREGTTAGTRGTAARRSLQLRRIRAKVKFTDNFHVCSTHDARGTRIGDLPALISTPGHTLTHVLY